MIDWDKFWFFFRTGIPPELLYPSLLVTLVVIIVGLLCKRIDHKKRFVLWVLLTEYMFVVVGSTIICRPTISSSFEKIQLTPFWTYHSIISHTQGVSVWDIVLNVVLFVPLGLLVKLLYRKLSLIKMVLIAAGCSLFIETNQYIFEKGIAQTDDVMHNVLGAVVGFGIIWIITKACSTSS